MVLIFSTPCSAARLSNAEKILLRKSMIRPAVNSALSVVKPTRSQNKMVASAFCHCHCLPLLLPLPTMVLIKPSRIFV